MTRPALTFGALVAFGLACTVGAAWPQDRIVWSQEAWAVIEPCDCAPAVARIVFTNDLAQQPGRHDLRLEIPGIVALIRLQVGDGDAPDTMSVTDASGYIPVPPDVTVQEGEVGTILLYTFDAVGM